MVNEELKNQGWKVLRFWSKEMRKDLPTCVEIIEMAFKDAEKGMEGNVIKNK